MKKEKIGTKELIRDVAIDLFSQKGYNAVSIREIARSVGITESSIYSHYKGKENIMDSIIKYLINEFKTNPDNGSIETILDNYDPEIALKMIIKIMLEQLKMAHIRKICRIMCIELFHNEKILDFFKNMYIKPSYQMWEQFFQKLIDKNYIKEYNPQQLSYEFFNYCIYLFFDCFIIHYDETNYNSLIDNTINKIHDHIKFIFEIIRINKT